jgi:60S ribosome subunit biogenesis protein NIP7
VSAIVGKITGGMESRAEDIELANYIGKNLVHLIDRDEDDAYCFRLNRDR